jgi:hypothetical protein
MEAFEPVFLLQSAARRSHALPSTAPRAIFGLPRQILLVYQATPSVNAATLSTAPISRATHRPCMWRSRILPFKETPATSVAIQFIAVITHVQTQITH